MKKEEHAEYFKFLKCRWNEEEVRNRIQNAIGVHDDLLTMVKKRKQMVWPHLKLLGHGKDNSVGDSERGKRERKTEKEMGRSRNGREWGLEIP